MATFTITNLTSSPVYIGDFYYNLAANEVLTLTGRSLNEVPDLASVQEKVADGLVTFGITPTADELASGMMSPPNAIQAQDLQAVDAADVAAVEQTFYKEVTATGAPDDVVIFAAGALPYKFRVLEAIFVVSTSPGASTADLRDEAAGAGTDLGGFDQGSTGRKYSDELSAPVVTPGAAKGLFLNRSDGDSVGYVLVRVRREA